MKTKSLFFLAFILAIAGLFIACKDPNSSDSTQGDSSVVVTGATLADKLQWLASNAASNTHYSLEVNNDEFLNPYVLSYSGKSNISIQLTGTEIGNVKTVELYGSGSLFTINKGVTLVLNKNIVLKGITNNSAPLVMVDGGNLTLNNGSKITGNRISSSGSGVYLNSGTFTMNGGEISGNTVSSSGGGGGVYVGGGTFTMNGGEISGNTVSSSGGGGGVYVDGGTFTMKGGKISGNTASSNSSYYSPSGGGVYVGGGSFSMTGGEISGNTASSYGGGVYIGTVDKSRFEKNGGIITGYSSDTENGNAVKSGNYVLNGNGHAVYAGHSDSRFFRHKEATSGQQNNLTYIRNEPSPPTISGDWDVPVPESPGTPVVTASSGSLTVQWTAVERALSYEVWIGTTNNSASATKRADVFGVYTMLTGLVNGTTYYVWLKAKNDTGASGFSPMASGTPLASFTTPPAPQAAPSVNAGNAQLVVSWQAVEGALSYEVWLGTTINPTTAAKYGDDISGLSLVITGLTNGTTYYVWIKAKNNVGTSDFSPMASGKQFIGNMGTVTLVSGNGQLTASWSIVAGAEQYEVYYSTSNSIPATPAQTISTTTATITSLINGTTYYIWVNGRNTTGAISTSTVVSGKPLGTPGAPTVSSDYNQLFVSWTAVAGADEYEVYYGTGTPTTLAATTSEPIVFITGLTYGITYHVRLRAKNSIGISDYGPSASGIPSNERSPGLYRSDEKIGNHNLNTALSYISANAVSGDDYLILLGEDESASPMNLYYSGKTVGITLLGYGGERKITLHSNGSLFRIYDYVTLTIDENISLIGINTNNIALVSVGQNGILVLNGGTISGNTSSGNFGGIFVNGGTLIMNGGTISGNTSLNYGGGGVCVQSNGMVNGTFTMNGGTISGNTSSSSSYGGGGIYVNNGTLTMYGGTISGNTSSNYGGGIYVNNGTLTMYGGTISGNTANYGGGIYVNSYQNSGTFKKLLHSDGGQNSGIIYGLEETGVDANGVPLKNTASNNANGHAVYFSSSLKRNTKADQADYIDTETGRGLSTSGNPPFGQ